MRSIWFVLAAVLVLAPASSISRAQTPPKPGPEMDILKGMEGTWDATVKMMGQESKGKMTYKMSLGGLWLTSNFEGEVFGAKFEGQGMDSYNAAKKKYVSAWADSMSTVPMVSEGTYDAADKKMTMIGSMPDAEGKMIKSTMITEFKDADTMVSTMSAPGPDGKDAVMMTIVYKRKK
jgi:hypothetical protein